MELARRFFKIYDEMPERINYIELNGGYVGK